MIEFENRCAKRQTIIYLTSLGNYYYKARNRLLTFLTTYLASQYDCLVQLT